MKITRAVLREISLSLKEWFEISSGGMQERRIALLTLEGDGVVGWGECVAAEDPGYTYETVDTAWLALTRWILPKVVGSEVEDARSALDAVPWVRGHRMAKAAVEMAGWDLEAKRRNLSLAALLGGEREAVPVGVSIGIQKSDEDLWAKVEGHLQEGYRKIKVKIKPGRDVEMMESVRARFPGAPFMADANSAYRLATDLPRLKALDEMDLMMIEQPLAYDDYLDHSKLQAQLSTPVCLDESIRSVGDTRLALHLGSTRIVNIKPGRVGGLASSVAIHDECSRSQVPVWCGGMLESGIGRAHNVALATLPGFTIPGDISNSKRYWAEDVVEPEFEMKDGLMPVPEGPGIGVTPRMDRIEALTTRMEVFEG